MTRMPLSGGSLGAARAVGKGSFNDTDGGLGLGLEFGFLVFKVTRRRSNQSFRDGGWFSSEQPTLKHKRMRLRRGLGCLFDGLSSTSGL